MCVSCDSHGFRGIQRRRHRGARSTHRLRKFNVSMSSMSSGGAASAKYNTEGSWLYNINIVDSGFSGGNLLSTKVHLQSAILSTFLSTCTSLLLRGIYITLNSSNSYLWYMMIQWYILTIFLPVTLSLKKLQKSIIEIDQQTVSHTSVALCTLHTLFNISDVYVTTYFWPWVLT